MSIGDPGNSDNRDVERELGAEEPAEMPDPSILDSVIEKTVSQDGFSESLQADELVALFEVARRHGKRPLELEPVVVDLVETIVKLRFKRPGMNSEASRDMVVELANSLFQTPASRQRLDRFWAKLIEAAS